MFMVMFMVWAWQAAQTLAGGTDVLERVRELALRVLVVRLVHHWVRVEHRQLRRARGRGLPASPARRSSRMSERAPRLAPSPPRTSRPAGVWVHTGEN